MIVCFEECVVGGSGALGFLYSIGFESCFIFNCNPRAWWMPSYKVLSYF